MTAAARRDYSLSGPENARAVAAGLANADWYHTSVSRPRMKALMQRDDGPATRDTLLWLGGLVATGALGALFWGSWASVPFLAVYGVLYGSAGDSRWHECGHGTAFRTPWKNEAVYQLACFLMIRNPVVWKWSHARHHSDTIIVGRDPEIVTPRPPRVGVLLLNLFGLIEAPQGLWNMVRYAFGALTADEKDFVPASEQPKVATVARVWLLVYLAVLAGCAATRSLLPVVLIGLPRFYGAWHMVLTGVTQHIGLAEDVLDHRLNARTVHLNPFSRFVYWNMNYHVEHHMFPMVPYHALPALHDEIKHDCPPAYDGFLDAYREILPALMRQRKDPTYFVRRELPAGAAPAPAAVAAAAAPRQPVRYAPGGAAASAS